MRQCDNLVKLHFHIRPGQEPGYIKFLLQAATPTAAGDETIIQAKEDSHWIPSNAEQQGGGQ